VTGRVTPGGTQAGRRGSRPGRPARSGRPGEPAPPTQIGRRPSNPAFLALMGLLWIGAGFVALTRLHAGWHLVPAIVFVGIGVLFLRGAAATVVRREARHDDG